MLKFCTKIVHLTSWMSHIFCMYIPRSFLSSHQRCSIEKCVLKNFTGKHLCQSIFFNKVTGLRPATLLIRKLWHRYFPMNFVKFLRTRFLQNISERLLLQIKNSIKNFIVVMPSSFYKDNDKSSVNLQLY